MLKIDEIDDFSKFEDLRGVWNSLLQRSADNDVFSSWEWIWCWWRHFGKGRVLRILIAKQNGTIVSIAPLMLSRYRFLHLGKIGKIEFIGSPHSDYNNLILTGGNWDSARRFVMRLLSYSDWDLLELRDIREGSASANGLIETGERQVPNLKLKIGTLCPYIDLPSSFKLFTEKLSRYTRRNFRKRMRKLRENYKVEIETQDDFGSIREAMGAFFKLHQKRWLAKGGPGAFDSRPFRDFHRSLAELFNEKGWLALYFLTVNQEPIAAVYSFDYNQKKYGYLTGFDPEFASYGVGNLLKMCVVKKSIEKGLKEYDLMRDFEPYKADWATGIRKNMVARIVWKGWFPRMYDWAKENYVSQLIIERLGGRLSVQHN